MNDMKDLMKKRKSELPKKSLNGLELSRIIEEYEDEIIQNRDTSEISTESYVSEPEIDVQERDIFMVFCPFCKKIGAYEPLDVDDNETNDPESDEAEMKHILFTCPQHGEIMVFWKEK